MVQLGGAVLWMGVSVLTQKLGDAAEGVTARGALLHDGPGTRILPSPSGESHGDTNF